MRALSRITVMVCLGVASVTPAHAAGLPQLDATWFPNQLFWLAVSFCVLFGVVSRVIAPSIQSVLGARENAIRDAIGEAEEARAQAALSHGKASNVGQTARAKAAELMAQAQAENSREAAAAIAKLDHELTRKARQADAALDDAVRKAEAGIDDAANSLAETIANQLLGSASANDMGGPMLKLAGKR